MRARTPPLITSTDAEARNAPAGDAEAWERALLDRQLERLDRLADMGLALAGEIQRRAAGAAPDADLTHAAMDFARVSRAVRMTLALQSKLVRDFKTPPKAGGAKADNDDDDDSFVDYEIYWADGTPITPAAHRRVLRQTVRGLAEDRGLEADTAERLETEALEALEREIPYPAPGNRPFHKFVAHICEELGLKPGATPGEEPVACPAKHAEPSGTEGAGQAQYASPSLVSDSS